VLATLGESLEATLPPMSAERRSWIAIQHVPFEGPGSIATAAARRGTPLRPCRIYAGDPLPSPRELRGLVVMGGPMGVSDTAEHPYLADELELIARTVTAGLPVLGVCLGAQLLAAALGAPVYRGEQPEIGPGTVRLTAAGCTDPMLGAAATHPSSESNHPPGAQDGEEPSLAVIHWHQDTFELPRGAVWLARSGLYPNQAFKVGARAYGLQFHVEVDQALMDGWREHLPAGVTIDKQACTEVERVGRRALAAFFDLVEGA
jgi:GMP synthase-like glutamine amidotransferase